MSMKRISKLSVKKTYKIIKQNIMKNWECINQNQNIDNDRPSKLHI